VNVMLKDDALFPLKGVFLTRSSNEKLFLENSILFPLCLLGNRHMMRQPFSVVSPE